VRWEAFSYQTLIVTVLSLLEVTRECFAVVERVVKPRMQPVMPEFLRRLACHGETLASVSACLSQVALARRAVLSPVPENWPQFIFSCNCVMLFPCVASVATVVLVSVVAV
jgi:hypothetical protein